MRPILPVSLVIMLSAGAAHADVADPVATQLQEAKTVLEASKKAEAKRPDGWSKKLSVGGTFLANYSKGVVGSADGGTFQLSILADGAAEYRKGPHQWLNEGKLVYGESLSPAVKGFVKSADALNLKSGYFYSLARAPWLGPFAQASLSTSMFSGYVILPVETVINQEQSDGTFLEVTHEAQDRIPLTVGFEPLLLKQVVGALANPVDKGNALKVSIHLGVGGEEVLAKTGYVIDKTDTTVVPPKITLKRLHSYQSVGGELEAKAAGTLNTAVSWSAGVTLFQPVYSSLTEGKAGLELLNIDTSAKVSVKLTKWASLDYVFGAKRFPLITEVWQVQTGILLTTTFNVI